MTVGLGGIWYTAPDNTLFNALDIAQIDEKIAQLAAESEGIGIVSDPSTGVVPYVAPYVIPEPETRLGIYTQPAQYTINMKKQIAYASGTVAIMALFSIL